MLDEIVNILQTLVAFDTVSSRSNIELIRYAQRHLQTAGIDAHLLSAPVADKASLWATIGPPVEGGVVLSGHSDVVPAEHQPWRTEPFKLTLKDARAYGRGAADMKGFIAVLLALAPRLKSSRLAKPIHMALTYDEELGCLGAPSLIEWAKRNVPRPAAVIVGEPTGMRVVASNKGLMYCRTEVHGVEAHSSLPARGISAVGVAARAIELLRAMQDEQASRHANNTFDPPHTTISVNRIHGGDASNIFAGRCQFDWDVRSIPEVDAAALLQQFENRVARDIVSQIKRQHPSVSCVTRVLADAPALVRDRDNEIERLSLQLLAQSEPDAVPYATEAGQYQRAGYRAIILGPGSIQQAHQPDEFIALEQLERCASFIQQLASSLQ